MTSETKTATDAAAIKTPETKPAPNAKAKKSPAKSKAKKPATKKARVSSNSGDVSPARGRKLGIGVFMRDRLVAGDDTSAILAAVHKQFPQSRATNADVSIIRRKARSEGLIP